VQDRHADRALETDANVERSALRQRPTSSAYLAAEQICIAEVDPVSLADIVIDNTDFAIPRRWTSADRDLHRVDRD
jgi:hypothetical protein